MSDQCIGYCFNCDLQVSIRKTPSIRCLRCNGDFVEVFELTPQPVNSIHSASDREGDDETVQDGELTIIEESDDSDESQDSQRINRVESSGSDTRNSNESSSSESVLNAALLDDTRRSTELSAPSTSSIFANPSRNLTTSTSTTNSRDSVVDSTERVSKRPRIEENEPASDDITCPICFDDWTNSGSHRLVSLKCGHLFGQSCIVRWIASNRKCAQCNAPNNMGDIRKIFAKTLKASDTSELEAERKLRIEIETKYNRLLKDISNTKSRMTNNNEPVFQAHRRRY